VYTAPPAKAGEAIRTKRTTNESGLCRLLDFPRDMIFSPEMSTAKPPAGIPQPNLT
jgi:hypothetical protein